MDLPDAIRHPYTAIGSALTLLSHGLGFLDPIIGLATTTVAILGATAGTWFPLLGVLSSLGKGLAFIPASVVNNLFLAGAVVYALFLSDSLVEKVKDKLGWT